MNKKIYYGWWISITALVVNAILSAPSFGAAGLWIDAFENEFGWTRTQLAIAFSLGQLEGTITSPFVGYLIDKIGGKKTALIGTFIAILGFLLLSQTIPITNSRDNIFDPLIFYISYLTIMLGGSMSGWVPMTSIVNNWFTNKRTLAMSIASSGFSIGTFLLVPLLALLINPDVLGWNKTALIIAIFMPLVSFLIWKIIYDKPADKLLLPYGEIKNEPTNKYIETSKDFTITEAIKEKVFWIMAFAHGGSAMLTSTMMVHLILAFKSQGLSLEIASLMWGITMGIGGLSQLFGGVIGDKFTKRYSLALFGCIQSIGVIIAYKVDSILLAIVFALIYGIGFGARAPITTAMRGEYFGRKSFGKIMGISLIPMMFMTMIAPVIAGYIYDIHQNYRLAFIYIGILGFIVNAMFVLAKPPIHPAEK